MDRVILHCDLNNFYASVECLYNPKIRDNPVAVCGSQAERRGIVLAKNQIAKKFNVKTGEPVWQAKKKCPGLITVSPNYKLYLKFSKSAREIYSRYTDLIESFGIDECWLDITNNVKSFNDGEKTAHEIKDTVKNELGITISVGVSYNKIFAKLGSDIKKPDAVTVVSRTEFKNIVWPLPVQELLYVGRATQKKLNNIGIYTIGSLACSPLPFMKKMLGKNGETLWLFANGYDNTPVLKVDHSIMVKGVGNSLTSPRDLLCNNDVKLLFYLLAESVAQRLRKQNLKGKTVQISIKDCDLNCIERQAKLDNNSYITSEIAQKAYEIFLESWTWEKPVRALGIRVTDLVLDDKYIQISFLYDNKRQKRELLEYSIDNIRSRFGYHSIQKGLLIDNTFSFNSVEESMIQPFSPLPRR